MKIMPPAGTREKTSGAAVARKQCIYTYIERSRSGHSNDNNNNERLERKMCCDSIKTCFANVMLHASSEIRVHLHEHLVADLIGVYY